LTSEICYLPSGSRQMGRPLESTPATGRRWVVVFFDFPTSSSNLKNPANSKATIGIATRSASVFD
jgi:hypothetical protein